MQYKPIDLEKITEMSIEYSKLRFNDLSQKQIKELNRISVDLIRLCQKNRKGGKRYHQGLWNLILIQQMTIKSRIREVFGNQERFLDEIGIDIKSLKDPYKILSATVITSIMQKLIRNYDEEKANKKNRVGTFLRTIIKSKLIDMFRYHKKNNNQISLDDIGYEIIDNQKKGKTYYRNKPEKEIIKKNGNKKLADKFLKISYDDILEHLEKNNYPNKNMRKIRKTGKNFIGNLKNLQQKIKITNYHQCFAYYVMKYIENNIKFRNDKKAFEEFKYYDKSIQKYNKKAFITPEQKYLLLRFSEDQIINEFKEQGKTQTSSHQYIRNQLKKIRLYHRENKMKYKTKDHTTKFFNRILIEYEDVQRKKKKGLKL